MRKAIKLLVSAALLTTASTPLQAATTIFTAALSGPAESPANASPGIGLATVTIDDVLHTMHVEATFSGLTGTTLAAHIHAPTAVPGTGTAGVATTTPTFAGFPLGVTSGTYDQTLNTLLASSYNPAFVTANGGTAATAEVALFNAMLQGTSYFNIHSSTFGSGEIRGFLTPVVPEPATWAMMICGFALIGARARKRQRQRAIA